MRLKKMLTLSALIGLGLSLTACSEVSSNKSSQSGNKIGETFKLGYDLELSGGVAAYGLAEQKGADLAVEEINQSGGILGKQVKTVAKDDKSDNAEAAVIATSLVAKDKVAAVIGTAASGGVKALTPKVTAAGVPVVTPSGTDDSLTVTKNGKTQDYVFRVNFQDSYQGKVMAKYASDNLKAQKVAVLYDNSSDYAKGITKAFEDSYSGKIVEKASFQSGDKDFQATLNRLKQASFDVLVVPGYYNETGLITKQARELGLDMPIVGGDGFADPTFVSLAGKEASSQVYYVSGYSAKFASSDKAKAFIKAYEDKYKESPSVFAALAYDSVYMIKTAAEADKVKDSKALAQALGKLKDFEGVTGKMTVDKQHNLEKSAVMIKLEKGEETGADLVELN